jgi:hypothetical protein
MLKKTDISKSPPSVIGIKYCGGCNPQMDRKKLVQDVEKLLPRNFILTTNERPVKWNIGILVCGCATACADKPELKKITQRWIIVGGHSVDQDQISEKKLADKIADTIMALK